MAYDDELDTSANNVVHAKARAVWKATIDDQRLYDVAECETRRLILSKVEGTWVRKLKHARA